MTRLSAAFILLFAFASSAVADEILLRNGHKITGIEREEKERIVVETGYGTVAFPRDQVVSVTKGETPMHAWPVRFAEVEKSKEAGDFTKLAAWARENGLPRYVAGLMRRAMELDPENAEARAALGYVRHKGKWVTAAELRKEQGLVQDGGRWVLPLEKELAERRRLEAEGRRLEREASQKAREESRRRAREEAELRSRIQAAIEAPVAYDVPWGWSHQDLGWRRGVHDLMLVDWLRAFRASPGVLPLSSPRPSVARPPATGRAPDSLPFP